MGFFVKKQKQAKSDFKAEYLPQNRKEQFLDTLKIRYGTLILLGLISLLFFIPSILCFIFRDLLYLNAQNQYGGDELTHATNIITYGSSFALIIGFMIFSIGLAGVIKVLKRLVWGEPVFFLQDFSSGVKENFAHFLLIAFIVGLFNFSSSFFESLLGERTILMILIYGINYAFIFPLCLNALFLTAFYKNHFLVTLKASFQLYIREFIIVIICAIVLYLFFLLKLVNILFIKYIVIIVSIVFIFPIYLLGAWESEVYIFDKRVNIDNYPELYRKGIYQAPKHKQ